MRSSVLVYYNTNCNFVLLEDQGLPEEDFVKKKMKKIGRRGVAATSL